MESGDIGGNEITTLQLQVLVGQTDEVSFNFKTSTEESYDFLKFRIDNVEQSSWSGEIDWTEVSYPISAGTHTLYWIYEKDQIVSDGADACWIDDIVLPSAVVISVSETKSQKSEMTLYPNPASDMVRITLSETINEVAALTVVNALGETIVTSNANDLIKGNRSILLDSSMWSAGIYMVTVNTDQGNFTQRLVKK